MLARFSKVVALALIALALSACAGGGSLPKLPSESSSGTYTLDSGDRLQVTVFGEERLTGTFLVADSGEISMPLIGAVRARGLTVAALESSIATALKEGGIVLTPSVSVQLDQFRPFFVLGEVQRPGQYPYVEGMTVLTAVAIAGGFTFRANEKSMSVTRTTQGKSVEYRAARDSRVRPGDVIYVRERYI
jgi:polysaccharide export outer membrane protein